MQLTQKHAFWRIARQNRSNGLTLSGAKERTKILKTQTINISPLCDHTPEAIDMPFSVSTLVPGIIIPAKFCVHSLTGFWEAASPKVAFPILIGTTLTTVLHYRADCDVLKFRKDPFRDIDGNDSKWTKSSNMGSFGPIFLRGGNTQRGTTSQLNGNFGTNISGEKRFSSLPGFAHALQTTQLSQTLPHGRR